MNKLRPFLAFLLVCLLLSVPVFADDEPDGGPDDVSSVSEEAPSVPEDVVPVADLTPSLPEDIPPVIPPDGTEQPSESDSVFDDVPPLDDSSGDYGPADGGAIESFQTTTDNGTSVILVDVQSHDSISVSSVSTPDASINMQENTVPENSMVQAVRNLFGTYTPRTQTVTTYYDGQPLSVDEQVIPGLGGLDWEWITGAFVFVLMLYCLFRLLGGILRNG